MGQPTLLTLLQQFPPRSSGGEQALRRSQVGKIIFGGVSHQVRRLFSLLNRSDRFEKKPAQGDDRLVARPQMLLSAVIGERKGVFSPPLRVFSHFEFRHHNLDNLS